jgi:hypothetical protein
MKAARFSSSAIVLPAVAATCMWILGTMPALGQHDRVASTLHNLSASGPGEIRALNETEICKFCHIPHNAVAREPLWGHTLSSAQYLTPQRRNSKGELQATPQPDGSSRLCLSCHDGTVALGDIGGSPSPIAMVGAQRLGAGRKSSLGTDLTGSHPISFVVPDGSPARADDDRDMSLRPLSAIRSDEEVRLDADGKMQCTTCHDAHSDLYYEEGRVPRFWVKPTVEEVCLTCHALR